MKAYKIELLIIDFDDIGIDEVVRVLRDQNHYPNNCISPSVINTSSTDIGEWNDDHDLNKRAATREEINKYFTND